MKTGLLLTMIVVLGGCGVELLTTTAIQGELQSKNLQAMNRQVGQAADSTAKVNIQHAIDTYQAEKGRLPQSLDELVPGYLPNMPVKPDGSQYGYDATTGKVLESPMPAPQGPTAGDAQKLRQIQDAINRYGMASGYYPPSLSALVPTYIAAVPKTDSGQDFYYDASTGALAHPKQRTAPSAGQRMAQPTGQPAAGVGAGGAGPMGEVMTGIGVQNQLNSMSNAGSSSAGTYMRGSVGGTTSTHNQQQEQAMDNLGL